MRPRTAPTGFLSKLFAMLLTTVLVVLGFMFSVVLLAVVAVLAVVGLGYFWWKTRAIRRRIREQMAAQHMASHHRGQSTVIDGEATVVRETPGGGNYLVYGDKRR